jgi:hypothetical protein
MSPGKIILIIWLVYAVGFTFAILRMPPRGRRRARVPLGKDRPLRLLVIGATGGTGLQLVEQVLAQGHEVTAFVRNPARLPLRHEKLRVVQGDVLQPAALAPAMERQRFLGPSRILSQGTANILKAMQNSNVPRFICESSLALGSSAGRGGLVATFFLYPLILPF